MRVHPPSLQEVARRCVVSFKIGQVRGDEKEELGLDPEVLAIVPLVRLRAQSDQ